MAPFGQGRAKLRLLHYNGDVDTVCNWLGALYFGEELAANLSLTVKCSHSLYLKRGLHF